MFTGVLGVSGLMNYKTCISFAQCVTFTIGIMFTCVIGGSGLMNYKTWISFA